MPDSLKPKDIRKLNEISDLLNRSQIDDALDETLAFTRARPRVTDGWELLVEITRITGETFTTWLALRQLCHLDPQDESYRHDLAVCALKLDYPFLGLKLIDDYLKRFPNGSQRKQMVEVQTAIRQELAKRAAQDSIPVDADPEALADLDEGRLWITYGETGEGRRLLARAARKLPNHASVSNNIALSYALDGNLTKALETIDQVLTAHPDNLFAQAVRGQLLVRLGREDEARTLIRQIAQQTPTTQDPWIKLVEACAYAHDHQLVLAVSERALAARLAESRDDPFDATIQCFIGTAQAFLGNAKKAQAAWKKVVPASPYYGIAQANLRQHRTHGPFYFLFHAWMTRSWLEGLAEIMDRNQRRSADRLRSALENYIARTPGLAETLTLLFERGDPDGLEAALSLAEVIPLPGLMEFATGSRGTDNQRMMALNLAAEHNLVSTDRPFTIMIEDKPTEIIPISYEVYYERDESISLPPGAGEAIEAAHTALLQKKSADALAIAEAGIAKFPDQLTLYNLKSNALHLLERHDEADAITRWLAQTHPDYVFGRLAMANLCIQAKQFDQANEWMEPVRKQRRYHISEFRGLALTSFRLHISRQQSDAAREWLDMLEEFDPDYDTDDMHRLLDFADMGRLFGKGKRRQ